MAERAAMRAPLLLLVSAAVRAEPAPPTPPPPPATPPLFLRFSSGADCAANGCSPLGSEAECQEAAAERGVTYFSYGGDEMEADYWGSEPWNLSPPGCIYCPTCPFDYPFDYSPNYRYFWNTIADGAACNSYDYCVCRCVRQPPPPPVPPLAPPHSPGENVFVRFTSGTDCAANGCSPLLEAECVGAYSSNLESYDFSGDKPQYTPGSWSGRPPG